MLSKQGQSGGLASRRRSAPRRFPQLRPRSKMASLARGHPNHQNCARCAVPAQGAGRNPGDSFKVDPESPKISRAP